MSEEILKQTQEKCKKIIQDLSNNDKIGVINDTSFHLSLDGAKYEIIFLDFKENSSSINIYNSKTSLLCILNISFDNNLNIYHYNEHEDNKIADFLKFIEDKIKAFK